MKYVYKIFRDILAILAMLSWMTGFYLASGFFSSFFAMILPPWAWYVATRALLIHFNI